MVSSFSEEQSTQAGESGPVQLVQRTELHKLNTANLTMDLGNVSTEHNMERNTERRQVCLENRLTTPLRKKKKNENTSN